MLMLMLTVESSREWSRCDETEYTQKAGMGHCIKAAS